MFPAPWSDWLSTVTVPATLPLRTTEPGGLTVRPGRYSTGQRADGGGLELGADGRGSDQADPELGRVQPV